MDERRRAMSGDEKLLSVSEQGFGKQTNVLDYRLQTRGGFGVINMKANEKTGKVVGVFPVEENSQVMIITQQAKLIRLSANQIRSIGRNTSGVRLIRTGDDDIVTSASLLGFTNDDDIDNEEIIGELEVLNEE